MRASAESLAKARRALLLSLPLAGRRSPRVSFGRGAQCPERCGCWLGVELCARGPELCENARRHLSNEGMGFPSQASLTSDPPAPISARDHERSCLRPLPSDNAVDLLTATVSVELPTLLAHLGRFSFPSANRQHHIPHHAAMHHERSARYVKPPAPHPPRRTPPHAPHSKLRSWQPDSKLVHHIPNACVHVHAPRSVATAAQEGCSRGAWIDRT